MTGDEGYKQNAVVAAQPGLGEPSPWSESILEY